MLPARRALGILLVALLLSGPIASAAVTYGSVSTASGKGKTSSKDVPLPAGVVAGDALFAQIAADRGTSLTITPPPGWTLVDRVNRSDVVAQAIFVRIATDAEPSTYTFSFNPSAKVSTAIIRLRGVDASAPVEAKSQATASASSVTIPSVSSGGDGRMLLLFASAARKATWTPPAGMTEITDQSSKDVSTTLATQAVGVGATGVRTALGSTSGDTLGQLVLVRPFPPPTVAFANGTSAASEASGSASIPVTLSTPSAATVKVNYAPVGGTATGGSDHQFVSGTLTFLPGETTKNILVPLINDAAREDSETLTIQLTTPVNAVLGLVTFHNLTITDDDPWPTIAFSGSSSSGPESDGDISIQVRLSAPSFEPIRVRGVLAGGSATRNLDFTWSDVDLVFSPGVMTRNLTVGLIDDALHEASENIVIALTNPVNATLGAPATHERIVLDNDPAPGVRFSVAEASVLEGQALALEIELTTPSGLPASVSYTTTVGTAELEDYANASGSVAFSPGETRRVIAISTVDDAVAEGDETFTVDLQSPTNAVLAPPSSVLVTILDDESPVAVRFHASASLVNETSGTALMRVILTGRTEVPVSFGVRVIGGTATRDVDYVFADQVFVIPAGDTSLDVPIALLDDDLVEPDETILFEIHDPDGALIANLTRHTLTVRSDDLPPAVVGFASGASSSVEGDGSPPIRVTLSRAANVTVEIDYATADETAIAGQDYVPISGTLVFLPGETQAFITVETVDDDENEPSETLRIVLSNPRNASLGSASHTHTIVDNDLPPPTMAFAAASSAILESVGQAHLTVTLSRAHTRAVQVAYATADGSARAPIDYVAASGILVIAKGQTSGVIVIDVEDDDVIEGNETFTVTLASPVNATISSPVTHTVTILNDDDAPLTVQFATSSSTGGEDTAIVRIDVVLNAATDNDVEVNYGATGGTATRNVDYRLDPGTLLILAGQTTGSITITVIEDTLYEGDETIEITISSPSNAVLGARAIHIRTILDNDPAPQQEITVQANPARWDGSPDVGNAWGGWNAEAGAANAPSTNYLKLVNTGTVPNPTVVIGFSATTFVGSTDPAFAIPLSNNIEFTWWEDTTPGSSSPSEGTYVWRDGGPSASITVQFTATGNVIYAAYRIKMMPPIMLVQSYGASFTVTEL